MPTRVQRKRVKGWRMPENTISVCRPSKWGNPFAVGKTVLGRTATNNDEAVRLFEKMLNSEDMLAETGYPKDFSELIGKNLACFCSLDEPCHVDVLLKVANNGG